MKKPALGGGEHGSKFNHDNTKTPSEKQFKNDDSRVVGNSFKDVLRSYGIPFPKQKITDQQFTRWGTNGRGKKNDRYWAKAIEDGYVFGDFEECLSEVWFPKSNKKLSKKQIKQRQEKLNQAFAKMKVELEDRQLKVAAQAVEDWDGFKEAHSKEDNPYLQKKQVNAYGVRVKESFLVIPLQDIHGKVWSYQTIDDLGGKRFLAGGRKQGCFHIIGMIDSTGRNPVIFVEGYATGASIHEATGYTVIVCFDAGNIDPVVKNFRDQYPSHIFLIAGDDDQWKGNNTGKETAKSVANKYGCKVVLPQFKATETHPTDFNDLHVPEGLIEIKRQINKGLAQEIKPIVPLGFDLKHNGLYYEEDWICSPIEIMAYTRDENNQNWGRLVNFTDLDGYTHKHAIPMESLGGDCIDLYSLLLSLGLRLASKKSLKSKLINYLQATKLEKRALCTSRIGWYKTSFILPDMTIPDTEKVYLQSDTHNFVGFETRGTLEEWQEHVALPCKGNSRLVFALSCAFAPPLLPLVHMESGGFNLKGGSSIGKSTALSVAGSVWGSSKYNQPWRSTGNALEEVAQSRNHALLCLDELGQVDGKEAGEISYMLANGSGKNRSKAKGGIRKKPEWQLLFLSTGEVSVADKLREAGRKVQAGMLTRMVDIPAAVEKGYGIFNTLHNFKDGHALSSHLKESTDKYYGIPIREYLKHLVPIKDQLPDRIKKLETDFVSTYVSKNADGQVQRVAQRFSLVAAVGEIAIQLGILTFDIGEAFSAVGTCFQTWLNDRGSTGLSYETEQAIKQVQSFVETHQSSRFALIGGNESYVGEDKIYHQVGYKKKTENGCEFYIYPNAFNTEICQGFNPKMVRRILAERGLLLKDTEGKYTKAISVPGFTKNRRMVFLSSSILTEDAMETKE